MLSKLEITVQTLVAVIMELIDVISNLTITHISGAYSPPGTQTTG